MTTSIWTGPGGTSTHPRSGAWEDASNWKGGAIPEKDADVTFAPGKYTVTLSQTGYEIGALNVGSGVTVDTQDPNGNDTYGYFVVTRDSNNFGVLHTTASLIDIAAGATLYNFGQVYGQTADYLGQVVGAGILDNLGVIHTTPGSLFDVDTDITNESEGVIDTRGGGVLGLTGVVTNDGLIGAVDGGTLSFSVDGLTGSTTNLLGGVLTGGHWSAGALSTLQFLDADGLDTIAAGTDVTLSGLGSTISVNDGAGAVTTLESSLSHIADGGALHILGGRDYASSQDLDVDGLLELGGGTLSSDGLTVHDDATSALIGYGVVNSDIDMYGVLRAAKTHGGASLALTGNNTIYSGSLVGSGVLEIAGGETAVHQGVHMLVKGLLVSGGELDLGEDLVYGGKLQVTGAGALHLGGDTLRITGSLAQVNGLIDNGVLQIESTAVTVQGQHAEWGADVRNNGEVDVLGGHLTLDRSVNGVGSFLVSGGATLEFAGAVTGGQTADLQGSGDKLVFDHAQTFKGQVAEFGAGDTLDFANFAFADATLSWKGDSSGPGGTLTVTSGADVAAIHLTDAHVRNGFHLVDDGSGHAAVTYGATSAAHADFVI